MKEWTLGILFIIQPCIKPIHSTKEHIQHTSEAFMEQLDVCKE